MSLSPGAPAGLGLSRLDRAGIFISSICFAHCLALPIVIALLPALAPLLPPDVWVHALLFSTALPVTGFTLWRGYRMHADPRPLLFGLLGLGLVGCGLFAAGPIAGAALTVLGGAAIGCAHLLNLRGHRNR